MLDRRTLLASAAALLAGACSTNIFAERELVGNGTLLASTDEPYPVAPVNMATIPDQFHRRLVSDPTGEAPGTIVVDVGGRHLFLVQDGGMAIRYGIGVGREGFAWNGNAVIQRKSKWPRWNPPVEMQARDVHARQYANGMDGGPGNPLGARAMYLYTDGRDTLYRIHGTTEPLSIGKAVSSGCIRMLNADVIDLYDRVPIGTKVVVRPATGFMADLFSSPDEPATTQSIPASSGTASSSAQSDTSWRAAIRRKMAEF